MTKVLIMGDTHFGNHEDFADYSSVVNSRLLLQVKAFNDALSWGVGEKCAVMIHLGDVFHKRGQVEPEAYNLVKQVLKRHANAYTGYIILTGNHDITMEGEIFNTAFMLQGLCNKTHVVTEVETYSIGGVSGKYVPFMKEGFEDALGKPDKNVTLFMHQAVFGAEYNRPIMKGVDPKFLRGFKRVWCGHIHQPQVIKPNINIVGSPYQINFGDSPQHHVFSWDIATDTIKAYSPVHPKFTTVTSLDKVKQDGGFYRVVLESPVEDVPGNVRVVLKQKMKSGKRLSAKNDHELLQGYVDREKPEDAKKLIEVGLKLLEDDKN